MVTIAYHINPADLKSDSENEKEKNILFNGKNLHTYSQDEKGTRNF